jgi:3D (Asp-Asp-Asp) domain-containing protein
MRIIRILVALITLLVILVPQITLASAEVKDSNETKTKFEIKNNFIIEDGVFKGKYDFLANAPKDFEGYSLEKTEEEIQREKALERYAEKRKAASYPQGKFTINASAYTAAADECGKSDGITASGLKVKEKETLACPPSFPFGTKIQIEGMGTYVCQDRGGAIKGNHIDIYMETKKEAFAFGRKNLLAEVVM